MLSSIKDSGNFCVSTCKKPDLAREFFEAGLEAQMRIDGPVHIKHVFWLFLIAAATHYFDPQQIEEAHENVLKMLVEVISSEDCRAEMEEALLR